MGTKIYDETDGIEEILEEVEMVETTSDMDVFDYAKQIIAGQIDQKAIQDDIKRIKKEAKEDGILVKEIDAVIADIKREMKKDPTESMIEAEIRAKFEADKDLMDSIAQTI